MAKTLLGNLGDIGPSQTIAQAEEERRKREEAMAKERALFQAAVVPAAQIAGGMIGGVAGAGVGGAAGESLRQWQNSEDMNVGNIAKEAAIGAGTQWLGGKVGEWLTKGKGEAQAVEAATKKPNIIQKAGSKLKQSKFDIEAKIRAGGYDADTAAKIEAAINNPEYGFLNAGSAKEARAIKSSLLKANAKVAEAAINNSTRVPNPVKIWDPIQESLKNVKQDKAFISEVKHWAEKLGGANTDKELYEIQGTLKKVLDATLEPGAKVNTGTKLVQKAFHDSISNYLKEIPEANKALQVMSDMHAVSPAIKAGVTSASRGIKVPVVSKLIGNLPGGELAQKATTLTGNVLEKVGGGLPSASGMGLPPIVGSAIAPAMQVGLGLANQGQQNVEMAPNVPETMPNIPQTVQPVPQTQTATGRTLEEHKNAYIRAVQAGDTKAATKIKQMYDMEAAFQKATGASGGKAIPSTQVTELADMRTSIAQSKQMIDDIKNNKGVLGPIIGRLRSVNPYDPQAQIFQSEIMSMAQNVGRAMEGGVLRQEDVKKYLLILPKISDTPEVAQAKLNGVIKMLSRKLALRQEELKNSGYTQEGTTVQSELPGPVEVAY